MKEQNKCKIFILAINVPTILGTGIAEPAYLGKLSTIKSLYEGRGWSS